VIGKKAKEIIEERVRENSLTFNEADLKKFRRQSKNFLLPIMSIDPEVFTSAADHGVRLAARFICEPRKRRVIEKRVWEEILTEFSGRTDIDFAYPTQRFYNNLSEGKPGIPDTSK
jgi:small-conductance mechanosensitive channel